MANSRQAKSTTARYALTALAALAFLGPTAAGASEPERERPGSNVVDGHYIVVYTESAGGVNATTSGLEKRLGFESDLRYRHAVDGFAAKLNDSQLRALERHPDVEFVSEDRRVSATANVPLATGDEAPTGPRRILSATKTTVREASNAAVAVIDTGIQLDHPDLNVSDGVDCIDPGTPAGDGNGHGTHVAGTVAAKNNGTGVVGVAPGTAVHAVRVLDDAGDGTWSQVICGVDWVSANAASLGIGVANMSLGGGGPAVKPCATTTDPIHSAICRSTAAGVNYVVAAGNSGWEFDYEAEPDVPAAYPEVLTVTALSDSDGAPGGIGGGPLCRLTEGDDQPASFSNYAATPAGEAHTVAAPGVCIRSTWPGSSYKTISGTSMAAPHVAGLVALCLKEGGAAGPCAGASPAEVLSWMHADAEAFTSENLGFGYLHDPLHSPILSPDPKYFGFLSVMPGSSSLPPPPPSTSAPAQEDPAPAPEPESEPAPPALPPADDLPPLETTITAAPRKIRLASGQKRARVKFKFASSASDARFRCALDRQSFKPCTAPFKARVRSGKHRFRIKTRTASDASARTMTKAKFRVRKAKR